MKDADIEAFMRQPWVMTCSDGSDGHPRKYGTFPRKLRDYVFDKPVISLPFAIRSSTSLPAQTLGLKDRGLLKPGYFADVLVFDPATIRDLATYESPTRSRHRRPLPHRQRPARHRQRRTHLHPRRPPAHALAV
jgi:N-acyl-D-amino-acid deacylase